MDNDRAYKTVTEERSTRITVLLRPSQGVQSNHTKTISPHRNRKDGRKQKSWVLQRDGEPAAFQQPELTQCESKYIWHGPLLPGLN